ncbi:ActS/PrrB/RegB family redox-sensitive histidine kinase [Amphiplicatus metriothermophilus]|uniref:histidine kinase n=1 Tax=Amphiplicatus metriothermophilus TaxID=1519374 RepID=A0A239PJU3_9PROT|nr:ActS/PrrB/RegB family redox-sensitive histidine kinase [Amphiplicatus metriothermophilus]MBB5517811.1 two-component system sensor histidine kinase RegB [Amphiplicatus metriothermophilus]SNT67855.1 two-component system, sensor histidine kinase RegB [Amphiplicatus metriothermophilus]
MNRDGSAVTPHAQADVESALQTLRGPVRLRTLTALRWLAVAGQTAAVLVVHFGFGFPTPLGLCLGVIAASAWLNLFAMFRYTPQRMLSDREAAGYIAFDIAQLCALLYATGGLQNPFAALILAPVTIAASVLPLRLTMFVGGLAIAGVSLLALAHLPLPWRPGEVLTFPRIYIAGVWVALTFAVVFFAAYAHRIAAEAAQMKTALAATQLALAREERLSALGGLAAAAAHELGTPLATIQVTAKEMADELAGQGALEEDAKLLVSQAERCRDILSRLTRRHEGGDAVHDRVAVDALLREAAEPFAEEPGGPAIIYETIGAGPPPVLRRRPEIIYGLRNIVENAAAFACSKILVAARWDDDELRISVHDDGPGFAPEILARLGEPYVSARGRSRSPAGRKAGMGLGFFIAKTLLERTGAKVVFDNLEWRDETGAGGAWVSASWPLDLVAAEKNAGPANR